MDAPLPSTRSKHNHHGRRSRSRSRDRHPFHGRTHPRHHPGRNHDDRRGGDGDHRVGDNRGGGGRQRERHRSRERSRGRDPVVDGPRDGASALNRGNFRRDENEIMARDRQRDDRQHDDRQHDERRGRNIAMSDRGRGSGGGFRNDNGRVNDERGENRRMDDRFDPRGIDRRNRHEHGRQCEPSPPRDHKGASPHLLAKKRLGIGHNAQPDDKLRRIDNEDPRGDDPMKRMTAKSQRVGNGRNSESFDPASTIARPDLRICVSSKEKRIYDQELKHDDVIIVPELFGTEGDWDLYYKLVEEMRALQKENAKGSEWISWHEGAHLISKNPQGSPTFEKVIDRLCEYFNIRKESIGTRFNWYRDSSDWKPFHHDSAAYNPRRARTQNITVGASFGAKRELAFLHAAPRENGRQAKVYFPQTNNGVFSFGRDVNILWKHGVNALPAEEQDGKGRISIILWGLAAGVKEETGSPPLLGSDGQGPHAQRSDNRWGGRKGGHHGRR